VTGLALSLKGVTTQLEIGSGRAAAVASGAMSAILTARTLMATLKEVTGRALVVRSWGVRKQVRPWNDLNLPRHVQSPG
jgi:hypothetical protein